MCRHLNVTVRRNGHSICKHSWHCGCSRQRPQSIVESQKGQRATAADKATDSIVTYAPDPSEDTRLVSCYKTVVCKHALGKEPSPRVSFLTTPASSAAVQFPLSKMFSPHGLLSSPATSQSAFDHQSPLASLNLVLPAPDNRHIAFRLLLDVAIHIHFSSPTDGVFLGMLGNGDVTPLRTAKLRLLKLLNPAWHPILDECEQELEPYLNGAADTPFPDFTESAPSNEPDYSTSLPQAMPLNHSQQSPQSADPDFNAQNNLPFWSGYDYSTDGLSSLPMHVNNYAACLESSEPCHTATPSTPLVDGAACSTGPDLGNPLPSSSRVECEIPSLSGAPNFPSPACPVLPGEPFNSISTYSSLLPESHCPPFANLYQSSVGYGLPSPDAISLPHRSHSTPTSFSQVI
ncbi:hypothetical protein JB92DRAFT_372288 [Gautieria morchelliformis]|nr:hypothetical protein JB92DRAFT_372288 [Gautieria morchelliformis]